MLRGVVLKRCQAGRADATADLIDMEVVHDRKEPRPRIAAAAPQVPARPAALERILHQVVGLRAAAHKRPRVAAQARDLLCDQIFKLVQARSAPAGLARQQYHGGEEVVSCQSLADG